MGRLRSIAELAKVRITVLATVTAAAGYVLASGKLHLAVVPACLGVVLLAAGACALNQVQEAPLDALMRRTARRPIPAGRMGRGAALVWALAFLASGLALLAARAGATPALLGLGAVVWYNAVYTYLKRVTAYAVVPGSLIGAAPPAIGYAAAGGSLGDPACLALCLYLFLWQVPHFWLLVQIRAAEYREAGFPVLTERLGSRALARVAYAWMTVAVLSSLLVPLFGALPGWTAFVLMVLGGFFLGVTWGILRPASADRTASFGFAFAAINLYALAVLVVLGAGSLAQG